jgi:ribose transport system permease protein
MAINRKNIDPNNSQFKLGPILTSLTRHREFAALLGLLIVYIIFCFISKDFFSLYNTMNIVRQASINAILAVGMTFVIISGGIDLSVGSMVSLTGTLAAASMVTLGLPGWAGIFIGLVVGGLIGLINGMVITKAKVPPIIATLAMMSIAAGAALAFTGGYPVSGLPASFAWIGRGYLGVVPMPVLIVLLVYGIGHVILKETRFGAYVFGLGGNEEATRLAGLNVNKLKIWVYVISGITAAVSGLILASRLNSGQPLAGTGLELNAIAAVVIGGASVTGGEGGVIGSLIGALIMSVLSNGLDLLNIGTFYQMIFTGIILILAVATQGQKKGAY